MAKTLTAEPKGKAFPFIIQARAGTDLVFSKSSEVIEDCRNQTENIA